MELIPFSGAIRLFIVSGIFLLTSCTSTEWQKVAKTGNSESRFMADIGYLADDKLEGRAFGTKGEYLAGNYIAKRFDLLEQAA